MKLRSHVLIIAAATLLPIIAIVSLAVVLLFQKGRDMELDHLVDTARALSLAVDRDFETGLASLRALATSQNLRTGDFRTFYDESKRVLAVYEGAEAIILVDPSGQQIINTRRPFGEALPQYGDPDFIKKVVEAGRPAVSNLFIGSIVQRPVISLGVPVSLDGQVKFALTLSLSPSSLQQLLAQGAIAADSLASIIDGNKIIVARTRELDRFLGKPAGPVVIANTTQNHEGWWFIPRQPNRGIEPSYAAHRRSEFSGWTVVIGVPTAKVNAPFWQAFQLIGGGVVVLLGVALGLAAVFGRRITGSIAALAAGAKALGSGDSGEIASSPIVELDQVRLELVTSGAARKRVEEKLRYELQLIRNITDSADECIFITDEYGNVKFANPEAVQTFGYSLEELLGQSLHETLHHSYVDGRPFPKSECVLGRTRVSGSTIRNHEDVFFRKDGSPVIVECSNAPVEIDGKRFGAVLIARDITERKFNEAALQTSEQSIRQLYAITNNTHQPFEERVRALLNLGCERFRLPIGSLTKLNGDQLVLQFVHSSGDPTFTDGMMVPLSSSYCRSVMDADGPLCFEHVGASEWRNHPGYLALRFESYMGTKVAVDGKVFGTVCFMAREPRPGKFTDADKDFLKLMSVWIGDEIARRQAVQALRASRDELELRVTERTAELTKSNALLREKEQHLTLAQQAGHAGLWSRDLMTGKNSMSPEWHELMGFPLAEESVSYAEFLNRVHPDDRLRVEESSLHQEIGDFDCEFRIVHPVKGERWIFARGRRGISTDDGHLRVMGALIDITERKQTEEALRQSEERLQHALMVGRMGTWERDLRTGETKWDVRTYEMFDVEPGTPISLDAVYARIHPDDLSGIKEAITNTERSGVEYAHEFRVIRPNGQIHWYHVSGGLRYDQNGTATHIAGINFDITRRKRAEEALRKHEEWLNQAVIVANLGIFEHDFVTEELTYSAAFGQMLDWPEDLTPSASEFLRRVHPDDQERVRSAIGEARASSDGRLALEYRIVRQDGSIGWLLVRSQLFFDGTGASRRLLRGVGAALDMTERKRAEEKLTEAKNWLQKVMDSSPDWIFAKDLDHRFLFVNRAFAAAQGLTPDDLIGKLDTEFWSEELCEGNPDKGIRGFHEDDRAAFQGDMVHNQADPATFSDGSVHIFDTFKSPMRDEANRIFGVLCYCRDTTERKRAEEALRASEERLQHALAVGRMGTWERDLGTGAEKWDRRTYEIFGIVEDRSVDFETFVSRVHPEDLPRVKSAVQRTERTGADYRCEYRILKPDGKIIWLHANGGLRRDRNGTPTHIAGINFDITERKQAEEALRESEARLRAILDHNPAPVFIKDAAGRYVHVNSRFEDLFGLQGINSIGKTDAELFARGQAEAFQANDRKVLNLGHAIQFEEVAQYGDGEHTSIVNKFPLRDSKGQIYALCGIATDITERKRAEEALRKLSEDLDRRVVERTQELADSRARLRALVAELSRAEECERRRLAVELHDYLAQMLTISRLSIGRAGKLAADDALKQRLAEAQQSVDDSIAYTRSLMAQLSPRVLYDLGLPAALNWLGTQQKERHGLHIEVTGEAEGFALDEERAVLAFQCVRELLWNIVKHAETNRALVSYAIQDGELTVEVADEGRGFDPESLQGNGHGLEKFGLFSIRERLEIFGGKLDVKSQPGRGTKVRFILPASQIQIAPTVTQDFTPERVALAAGKRLSVALVDDHAVVRRGLRQVLEEFADLTVVGEAKDGLEGVELAREFKPDVVVMDVHMPRMNGIEATKLIRQEMPSTIVVGLSFESGAPLMQAMKAAGAFTCVTKERAVEDIHQAIMDAVEERRGVAVH